MKDKLSAKKILKNLYKMRHLVDEELYPSIPSSVSASSSNTSKSWDNSVSVLKIQMNNWNPDIKNK